MLHRAVGALVLLAPAVLAAGAASAGGQRAQRAPRQIVRDAPLKDCTRINGRYGYYGNPWCNAHEQDRWDRWSAGRGWGR
jgi:hypothetical protein